MGMSRRSLIGLAAAVLVIGAASQWWAGRHDGQVGARVAALARPGDIRMLGSETCAVCAVARAWFDANRIPYSECLIERDEACRAAFDAGGWSGTPVILVRGRPQLGFSPELLQEALSRS